MLLLFSVTMQGPIPVHVTEAIKAHNCMPRIEPWLSLSLSLSLPSAHPRNTADTSPEAEGREREGE